MYLSFTSTHHTSLKVTNNAFCALGTAEKSSARIVPPGVCRSQTRIYIQVTQLNIVQ